MCSHIFHCENKIGEFFRIARWNHWQTCDRYLHSGFWSRSDSGHECNTAWVTKDCPMDWSGLPSTASITVQLRSCARSHSNRAVCSGWKFHWEFRPVPWQDRSLRPLLWRGLTQLLTRTALHLLFRGSPQDSKNPGQMAIVHARADQCMCGSCVLWFQPHRRLVVRISLTITIPSEKESEKAFLKHRSWS